MIEFITIEMIDEAAEAVRRRIAIEPKVGIILGSGLGGLAEGLERKDTFPTEEIPYWPVPTVEGHAGRLIFGVFEGQSVIVMQGRPHYYEGYSMPHIGLPIRVMRRLGVETLIVTNAAGAVNPKYSPGDLMCLSDHINLIGMAGNSPLRGKNLDEFGLRFPDMSRIYDRDLIAIARKVAAEEDIPLWEGIYVCLAGPSFETPADLRFLRGIGVDAVGMSTVPEVTVARHSGIRVVGISGISNKANLDGDTMTTHEEVLAAGKTIVPKLTTIIKGLLKSL